MTTPKWTKGDQLVVLPTEVDICIPMPMKWRDEFGIPDRTLISRITWAGMGRGLHYVVHPKRRLYEDPGGTRPFVVENNVYILTYIGPVHRMFHFWDLVEE